MIPKIISNEGIISALKKYKDTGTWQYHLLTTCLDIDNYDGIVEAYDWCMVHDVGDDPKVFVIEILNRVKKLRGERV